MKALISFILLFNSSAFAVTFTTKDVFSSMANDTKYTLEPSMTLEISKVDIDLKIALVSVNGKTSMTPIKLISQMSDAQNYFAKFNLVVKKETLLDGRGCDESESVSYELVFNYKKEIFSSSAPTIELTKLSAIQKYSWDICHDPSPEKRTYNYTKN